MTLTLSESDRIFLSTSMHPSRSMSRPVTSMEQGPLPGHDALHRQSDVPSLGIGHPKGGYGSSWFTRYSTSGSDRMGPERRTLNAS
jgi:hypothetical protein